MSPNDYLNSLSQCAKINILAPIRCRQKNSSTRVILQEGNSANLADHQPKCLTGNKQALEILLDLRQSESLEERISTHNSAVHEIPDC